MFRFPKLVRHYLSAPHLPIQPAIPMIGPIESRWRHDFASGPDIASQACSEGRRGRQKILRDAASTAIRQGSRGSEYRLADQLPQFLLESEFNRRRKNGSGEL